MTLSAWGLATIIGLSLGLLGGGGSILTVPVFTYVLGYPAKQAIAMSLPVVGLAAATGAVAARRRGTLALGPALAMAPATMAGSYAGARAAAYLDGSTQLTLLAVAMLSAAAAMWQRSRASEEWHATDRAHPLVVAGIGIGVGLLTGLVGIGGGFMIVPALVVVGGIPMREATSTALLVIALSTLSGLAGYRQQVSLDWATVAIFAGIASLGVLAGGQLAGHIPARRLQQAFAGLLLALAAYMLLRPA
ncbi:MAG: sulfite exporter TauE/SafE family protein [Vicinamibacterales bacterium]